MHRPDTSADRALGLGVIGFIAILVASALLFTLFDPAASQILADSSSIAENSKATDHIDTLDTIWSLFLFYSMFVAGLFIIARSVFESRGGRP